MHRVVGAVALAVCSWAAMAAHAAAPLVPALPGVIARAEAVIAGRPAPDELLSIAVVLPLRQPDALTDTLHHRTDPADPLFRHWLSARAFGDRFGPSMVDYQAVRAALAAGGLDVDAPLRSRIVVDARGRVADVERVLHVRFGFFKHSTQARLFLSADREPTLDVAAPTLAISGLEDFDRPLPHVVQAREVPGGSGSGPDGQFTGPDMRHAYYGNGPLTGVGQSVGVFELGAYDPNDISTYFQRVGAPFSVPIAGVSLNGLEVQCSQTCHDVEEALDIEDVISMAPGLDQLIYYGGKLPISILARMASDDLCATLSVSWGWKPRPKIDEPVLEEMAAQGQTLLVATGDNGFHLKKGAVWPADDSWSIAVGGTDLRTPHAGGPWQFEKGWRFSGGGPSPDGIALPAWQAPFVTKANGGSHRFRNVPDIAAEADTDNFTCYDGKCKGGNGGTSYAAPIWAGFIALTNEQAAAAGQPTVGFFTPALYARALTLQTLHDQIIGYNGRYVAQPGFDLVTGLGSPFGALTMKGLISP